MERARRLLAHEGLAGDASTAAGRVYDKLHDRIALLVGDAGVRLLFVRSAKLARGEFACFAEVSHVDDLPKLRDCFQAQDPTVATESAVALFGTFLALITTFIGERLTTQVLRSIWPTIAETAPLETTK